MTIPNLVEVSTLEAMIASCKATFEALHPTLLQSESDYYMPVIEAQAEREFRLRVEINKNFKNQFWMVAEGAMLDFAASEFGVTRLKGSKPYADFRFTLSEVKSVETRIPEGMLLGDEEGLTAHTLYEVVIPAGALSAQTKVQLDQYVVNSENKTEQILTPFPYVLAAKQLEAYHDGKAEESDEALRRRVELSLDALSAAGPYKAYQKMTLDADSRIQDVKVFEIDTKVQVVIDSSDYDAVMVGRVEKAIASDDKRPLTDKVEIYQAQALNFDVTATLEIKEGYLSTEVIGRADEAVRALNNLRIGESLSQARVIEALFVDGVRDIALTAPTQNLQPTKTQVLKLGNVGISNA